MATGKPIRNMMFDYSRSSTSCTFYRSSLGSSSRDERILSRYCLRILLLILAIFVGTIASVNGDSDQEQQKNFYIVYMGDSPRVKSTAAITDLHVNALSNVFESEATAKDSIVHSYMNNFNAFAARLSADEALKLASTSGVVSVFRNRYHKLHTTKSWDYIGFPQTIKRNLKAESNIIVGLLDTGITPKSQSFTDKGFGPPPAKWKGSCGPFANFSGCNNKLIGAQYFKLDGNEDPGDIMSPTDMEGHGTHTSSTLAGNPVKGASVYGIGAGTSRGAVPSARIAMYKVCWVSSGCSDMDLLAAFDAAIHDGVDVISISIGGGSESYLTDSIAIGAFHAMKKGILTVASAGNQGPSLTTVVNHAPWILTVAASGTNRQYRSKVMLGNGKTFSGLGVNTFTPKRKLYPLISGANADGNMSRGLSRYCVDESLVPEQVKGKLVYCILQEWGADAIVNAAGGIGSILAGDISPDTAQIFIAPGTMINEHDGQTVSKYISSTKSPSAVVYKSQEVNVPAPFVASFSSRGPSMGSRNVLKPDITAPGIDILASYTPLKSLTGLEGDPQFSDFTIMSGTSMACPHVAGVAAYIKSFHPAWSPAAIQSAIMTTATPMSSKVNQEAELAYGAGQMNPSQVVHPGLIYDMDQLSYIQFLCNEGYKGNLGVIVGSKSVNCSTLPPGRGSDALNYPTMQLTMNSTTKPTTAVFRRRVTNVGPPASVYTATINAPKGVEITVSPMSLSFTGKSQKKSFKVVVKATPNSKQPQLILSGSLVWKSSIHTVRSPIVISNPDF